MAFRYVYIVYIRVRFSVSVRIMLMLEHCGKIIRVRVRVSVRIMLMLEHCGKIIIDVSARVPSLPRPALPPHLYRLVFAWRLFNDYFTVI